MLINLMKSLNSCAFASALPLPDSATFPSLKAGWKVAEQIFSFSDGVIRGSFARLGLERADCPWEDA
ncbi:MAG: hypothetical protein DME21_01695 [Verrucomicrobia bacterium]|nr:MAG: hypothetical protein DME21_01695 [Verrucomicrobiota bacterium]